MTNEKVSTAREYDASVTKLLLYQKAQTACQKISFRVFCNTQH